MEKLIEALIDTSWDFRVVHGDIKNYVWIEVKAESKEKVKDHTMIQHLEGLGFKGDVTNYKTGTSIATVRYAF